MMRFLPRYVDVSVVASAAPVRRTKPRAKASVASRETRTTKGVSFRGFVTSFLRTPERSSTRPSSSPVSTFRTMPSSTFKAPTTGELPHDFPCRCHTFHPAYAFTCELTHGIDVACRRCEERDGRETRHRDLGIGSPGADPPTDDVTLEAFGRFDRGTEDPVRRIPAEGKGLREDGVLRFGGDELL